MMKATTWRRLRGTVENCRQFGAPLAASIALAQCSTVPPDVASAPMPPANYAALVANNLKTFKGFADYTDFQISALRWVHVATGWSWLTCVRYLDHGKQRYYSYFISGNSVDGRYDVRADRCRTQQYTPLNVTTGAIEAPATSSPPAPGVPPTTSSLPPPSAAPTMMQGPIY